MNMSRRKPVIVISIDTDWSPLECLEDTLMILRQHDAPATVFATVDVPDTILANYDIGIHPNFTGGTQDEIAIREELSRCVETLPRAKGFRSHALVCSTRHLLVVRDHFPCLKYTSMYYLPGQLDIRPIILQSAKHELPIFWMDHLHLEMNENMDIKKVLVSVAKSTLAVFDFHPFHVFINSVCKEHFEKAKGAYHDPKALLGWRRAGNGVRRFLIELLAEARTRGWDVMSCSEVVDNANNAHEHWQEE